MPDELTEPTEATEEEATEPETTEPEPDPWYVKAGFDSEDAALKKVTNLKAWEAEVTRKSQKAAEAPAPEPASDDPWAGIDPESRKVLQRIIDAEVTAKVANVAPVAEATFANLAQQTFNAFAEKQDLDTEQLATVMNGFNLWPDSYSLDYLNQRLTIAAAYLHEQNRPNEKAAIEEKVAEEAAKRAAEGESIVAVKPGKQTADKTEPVDYDSNASLWGKLLGG